MHRGYVKLFRKALDDGMLKDHKLWAFWTWCLLKANHKDEHKIIVNRREVILKPGQFIFGRRQAAAETGLTEQQVRSIIKFLIRSGKLSIKTTNCFSVVSITNWDTYQGGYQRQQPADQPASNQQVTTNKNVKNVKSNVLAKISSFLEKYEDPEVIRETLEAISSSRKTRPMSDTDKLNLLRQMDEYPPALAQNSCRVFLEKGCHKQGKDEKYLMGIIGKQNSDRTGEACSGSSGSHLYDDYIKGEIKPVPEGGKHGWNH